MSVIPILIIADHSQDAYKFWKMTKVIQNKVQNKVKFYFLYSDENQEEDIVVKGDDIFVKVEENVKKGCTIKTYRGLQWVLNKHPDAEFVIRANLSIIVNVDNLVVEIQKVRRDVPTVSGLVYNNFAFGSFIIWNRKLANILAKPEIIHYLDATGYKENDDITFTRICRQCKANFDTSMTPLCKEHPYSYFYFPNIGNNWVTSKKIIDDVPNRSISDEWSVRNSTRFPKEVMDLFPPYEIDDRELVHTMMNALRNLDCTSRPEFFIQNLNILMNHLQYLDSRHGELIYYIVKYVDNINIANHYVREVLKNASRESIKEYISVIFHFAVVKQRLSKVVYDEINMPTGHYDEQG